MDQLSQSLRKLGQRISQFLPQTEMQWPLLAPLIYGKYLKKTSTYLRGVMVIVVGNGHGDTSSNPGRDWLHFT